MFKPVEDFEMAPLCNVKFSMGIRKNDASKLPSNGNILSGSEKIVVEGDDESEIITHIEDRKVKGTKPERDTAALVIPMIVKNDWRLKKENSELNGVFENEKASDESGREDLRALAKVALLQEARGEIEVTTSLLFKNRVPSGFETDSRLDVSLRPDAQDAADYDTVPVDAFGLAMLRGMGWKEGDPIGRTNRRVVPTIEPQLRPKGLGLGADRRRAEQLRRPTGVHENNNDDNSNSPSCPVLDVGCFVKLLSGPNRQAYARVDSFDEDNARVVVRLAIGNVAVSVSQFQVEVVDEEEYERDGKCINNSKYNRFKKVQESQFAYHIIDDDPLVIQKQYLDGNREFGRKRHRPDRSPMKEKRRERKRKNDRDMVPWVRRDLRVRFMDKNYKNGRFYKTKMIILNVMTANRCSLLCPDGSILEDIHSDWLETVIPHNSNQPLMVVRGEHCGSVGFFVGRNVDTQTVSVQLNRTGLIIQYHFDDVCEYNERDDDLY